MWNSCLAVNNGVCAGKGAVQWLLVPATPETQMWVKPGNRNFIQIKQKKYLYCWLFCLHWRERKRWGSTLKVEPHLWAHSFRRHNHLKQILHFMQLTQDAFELWCCRSCNQSQTGIFVIGYCDHFLKGAGPCKSVTEIFLIFFPMETLRSKGTGLSEPSNTKVYLKVWKQSWNFCI